MPTESNEPIKVPEIEVVKIPTKEIVKAPTKKVAPKVKKVSKPSTAKKLPKPPAKKVSKPSTAKKDEKIEKNGASRPRQEGNCLRIWEICDAHLEKNGIDYLFREVIKQSENEHIPNCTARQQIWRWRAFNGFKGRIKCVTPKMPKIVLPKAFLSRKKAELKSPGKLPKPPKKSVEAVVIVTPTATPIMPVTPIITSASPDGAV